MQALQEAFDGFKGIFDFVSGANDVILVKHLDGTVKCSVFSVQTNAHTINRHLLGSQVDVLLNGRQTPLKMKIGDDGRCVFMDGTYVPPLDILETLPLKDDRNSLDFRVGTHILSNASLFAWKSSDLVVIVDIDGTITRTDSGGVLASSEFGQTLGLAHAHKGVCSCMSSVASAGYRLLFLTARPITRSEATRKYLSAIGHEESPPVMMPSGALITSALGTLGTMASVWAGIKKYKAGKLDEIQALFDSEYSPSKGVYAGGFGNHGYDAEAYLEAGCPKNRVFIIDEDSNISIPGSDVTFNGYVMLKSFVPDLFPPLLVVNWAAQGGGHDMPLPASEGAARRAISLNKIPGYAYIGEGLGKVGGIVVSTATGVGASMGEGLEKLPGAQSVKKGLSGVGSVVPFPIMSKKPPPPYDGLEAQGLVDMGP